jgi:hypothetical protein
MGSMEDRSRSAAFFECPSRGIIAVVPPDLLRVNCVGSDQKVSKYVRSISEALFQC